ncbi:TRAP transporter small permease [Marinobacter algicola]|uniref:TRAP transporter small permease n=1 Tax=Marinobacter algicola TaxID=236100 RepID=UPI003BAAA6CD
MKQERPHLDFLQRFSVVASWLGGVIVLASAIAISFDVLTRNMLGKTYLQSFELSQYGFAIAVAFGLSAGVVGRDHIRIDVLANVIPKNVRRILHFISIISLVIISALLAYFAVELTIDSYNRGARSPTSLRLYTWIPQAVWALGLCIFAMVSVWTLIKSVRCLVRKDYKSCDSLIGFQGSNDN